MDAGSPDRTRGLLAEIRPSNGSVSAESKAQRHAERLVRALVDAEQLELATPHSEPAVTGKLVTPLEEGWSPSAIAELLLDLDPVSDLFCDDDELGSTIESTREQ